MAKGLVRRILQQYGVSAAVVAPVQKGYRNESYAARTPYGHALNLIIYKREPGILGRIRNANYVADFLAEQGMPTRRTADTRIMKLTLMAQSAVPSFTPRRESSESANSFLGLDSRLRGSDGAKYAALYEYLSGATIPWEAYTMRHIKLLGQTMSDMHASLQSLPRGDLPSVANECLALLARMEKYFADDGARSAMSRKLNLALRETTQFKPAIVAAAEWPSQALHMDFVRGNILFEGEGEALHISGILDFEKAAWGAPAFDIARTLAFLIIDCKYKEQTKVRKYFVHSGYNKRGRSSFAPDETFEQLVDFFLLHDFYKFLRHNPYESLEQNAHFLRTRDFLLKRNILAKTKMLQ